MKEESAIIRHKRYTSAKSTMDLWLSRLTDIYDLFFPYRNDIYYKAEASSRQNQIFDETGMMSAKQFASNLQSILMPSFQRWIELIPGKAISEHSAFKENPDELKKIKEKLQQDTEILFDYLDSSDFSNSIAEAFQDLTVGTGFLQINEGSIEEPFIFKSIPIGKIIASEGSDGRLQNFWREWEIPLIDILQKWPLLKMPSRYNSRLKETPYEKVKLIEGCLYYPSNPFDSKYFYYVRFVEDPVDVYKQWMSFSPFIGFRYEKAPGETLGIGVAQYAYPAVRVLNAMTRLDLKSFKFRAFPAYVDASGRSLNPNTARIEPGALIVVSPDFGSRSPIQPIPVGGDPRFSQLSIQLKQQRVKEIMMAEPLGEISQVPTKTATEIAIRQRNYIQRNAAAASRLAVELIKPIIDRCIEILRKKALITDIQTSVGVFRLGTKNKIVSIHYKSPVISLQDSKDVAKLTQWAQLMLQLYGVDNTLMAVEKYKVPYYVAEKLGVDLELVKGSEEFEGEAQQAAQTMMQLQQAQQAQQQPEQGTPLTGVPGGQ